MSEIKYPQSAKRLEAQNWVELSPSSRWLLSSRSPSALRLPALRRPIGLNASHPPSPGRHHHRLQIRVRILAFLLPILHLSSLPVDGRIHYVQPKRGDIAVFISPRDGRTFLVKRVIGLPGDKVQMIEGRLYINTKAVDRQQTQPYLLSDAYTNPLPAPHYYETLPPSTGALDGRSHEIIQCDGDNGPLSNTETFDVPPDHFFVMGDNRDNSEDLRVVDGDVGFVPAEYLVGRADLILYSFNDRAEPAEIRKWPAAFRSDRFFRFPR